MLGWMVGGLITVSAIGLAVGTGISSAAEKNTVSPAAMQGMMQNGSVGAMDPKMMESPEMQQQCQDMLKNAEMQQAMIGMMKQPQTQAMMKQMFASDPELRQMMTDLVNSADANDQTNTPAATTGGIDHSAHHSS